ncbi:unnamed protein product [Rotaria magnacalcarata]|uniref:Uncharacterized protein n=1 Tax=Rotaria magnacalcarata TaxID=392030 RepID=A0A816GWY7_9BILA|nr:unnamed protein product [Rotaria magnacalcarata]
MKSKTLLLLLVAVIAPQLVLSQSCFATTWSTWACSVTCGNGTYSRTRNCITNTTASCSSCWETSYTAFQTQTLDCIRGVCPYCSWTNFTVFPCSASCNTGFQLQTRQCLTATGQACGTCDGSDVISQPCTQLPACPDLCPINSHIERNYTDCSITCQNRTGNLPCTVRSVGCVCDAGYLFDSIGGQCIQECDCGCTDSGSHYRALNQVWNDSCSTYICNYGGTIDTIATICNTSVIPTPVNGGWTDWQNPTPVVCSATCGNGVRPQYRTCTNPTPENGGLYCSGSGVQLLNCSTNITCPGSNIWSTWSAFSGCSATCGNGTRTAYRNCTIPSSAASGSASCNGSSTNVISCFAGACPINGAWTAFSNYSTCSSICSDGLKASSRTCVNQTSGGFTCSGYGLQFANCSGYDAAYQCDAIGFWSNWTSWSTCSVSCGVGFQFQTRTCLGAGFGCVGEAINTTICNTSVVCPVDGTWTSWSTWSSCPTTCGTATVYRTRNCTGASNGGVCLGSALDTQLCDTNISCTNFPYNATNGGYTAWSTWGSCSSTCGTGVQIQTRSCTKPLPTYGGSYCVGSPINITSCNATQPCPIDGNWATWTKFSSCSGTCGNGTMSRIRICANPSPSNGGQQCSGPATDIQECSTNIDCPVDGVWGNWTLTTPCFGVCGNGTLIYTRNCTPPIGGGLMCVGPTQQVNTCDLQRPCPINGGWSNWTNFTTCSVTCGVGVYSRIRNCNSPVPQYGGDLCVGAPLETAYCLTNVSCPINGGWTTWTSWSNCSLNCSGGMQTRTRNCTNPSPANNGAPCIGSSYQYQTCNDAIPCVIFNGTWGSWTIWAPCSGTCGNGTRSRFRNCSGEYNGGNPCVGSTLQYDTCNTNVTCPTDGGWSSYTTFGPCSATCGNGTQVRTRNCNSPVPSFGGSQCVGNSKDTQRCLTNISCPIDGGWSVWAQSPCSSTCGIGYRVRQRNCTNPTPQFGGIYCLGSSMDTIFCNVSNVTCPVMGTWGAWINATSCSVSCGFGISIRNRTCLPAGSINCVGDSVQVATCDSGVSCASMSFPCILITFYVCILLFTVAPAPWKSVNGNWSGWSNWSPCSVSCGNGTQYQTRACNTTTPSQGGSLCRGDALQTQTCTTNLSCPVNGNWTEWGGYSPCSTTCGTGIRSRIRYCNNTNNFNQLCIGPALETILCNQNSTCPVAGVWGTWTGWSICSGSCGTGLQVRTRNCTVAAGGQQCSGSGLEAQQCNTNISCPVDGGWGPWTNWTACSSGTCAAGSSYQFRTCDNPPPSNGGQMCTGDATQTVICVGVSICPIDGGWSSWSPWTGCSSTCVGGRSYRYRNCSNPVPSNGGISCVGSSVDVDSSCGNSTCGSTPAVAIGVWLNWNSWSNCATTCGSGIRRRTRNCTTTGLPCVGLNYEIESCNSSINCPVDGIWGVWSSYSDCTASCGTGTRTQTRLCLNQSNGGQTCYGSATKTIPCSTNISCPINGQWTTWSSQSPCSATCGTGFTVRTRTCSQVIPTFGGVSCPGSSVLYETCTASQNCSVDGQWGSWKPWSACTATCGKNSTKYTTRRCDSPAPLYGGNGCGGLAFNVTNCIELPDCSLCGSNQVFTNATPASCPLLCSNPNNTTWCLKGKWIPTCLCQSPYAWNDATNSCALWCDCGCYGNNNGKYAVGSVWQEDTCRTYQCMNQNNTADAAPQAFLISSNCTNCSFFGWSTWSGCNTSCGQGYQTRTRSCLFLNSNTPCNTCNGNSTQMQICESGPCEVCQPGPYEPATQCSKTCGNGTQTLNRTCLNIASASSSIPQTCSNVSQCGTNTSTVGTCNPDVCIICNWSTWANGPCSVTCGTGSYIRTTNCIDQFFRNCTTCTNNTGTINSRPCFYPSCTGRRRRSLTSWLLSWLGD